MIDGLAEDIQAFADNLIDVASNNAMDAMMEAAPVDTGALIASAVGPNIDGLSAYVAFTAIQADFTDQGTQPHDIYPAIAPRLVFFWQNGPEGPGVYSYQHVFHPGYVGSQWFSDVVDDWDSIVQDAIDELGG